MSQRHFNFMQKCAMMCCLHGGKVFAMWRHIYVLHESSEAYTVGLSMEAPCLGCKTSFRHGLTHMTRASFSENKGAIASGNCPHCRTISVYGNEKPVVVNQRISGLAISIVTKEKGMLWICKDFSSFFSKQAR